ncbi:GbsR/MarR family transcriptional regulator [Streptomyces sp. NPDC059477]|uniref:GbsR/MarR family transcriptional regulator n=1 Tax=Streptomyces sp. NPDC059477 TaxID=3346847 RepID=UPI00367A72D4
MPKEDKKQRSEPEPELEFADRMAQAFEGQVPRMAGRMLGLLLITEEPQLSSKDLVTRLGASAATVSTMGRLLINLGLIERTVSPETRRDLFTIAPNAWVGVYRDGERYISEILDLLDHALADPALTDTPRARIREMYNLYAFLWAEIPDLVSRYEQWRAENGPEALFRRPGGDSARR